MPDAGTLEGAISCEHAFRYPYSRGWGTAELAAFDEVYGIIRATMLRAVTAYGVVFHGFRGARAKVPQPLERTVRRHPLLISTKAGRRILRGIYGGRYAAPVAIDTVDGTIGAMSEDIRRLATDTGNGQLTLKVSLSPDETFRLNVRHEGQWGSGNAIYDGARFQDFNPGYAGRESHYVLRCGLPRVGALEASMLALRHHWQQGAETL